MIHESSLVSPDLPSFRRQESGFAALSLTLLVLLFLAQLLWPKYLGEPHKPLLAVLAAGIAANLGEVLWLNNRRQLGWTGVARLTWTMIAINLAVAFGVASYSDKQDVQDLALMLPPIFQAAFRLSLPATIVTVTVSDGLIFFWVWNYFRVHPPVDPNEYIGAGTIALIYAVTGLLVWTLVNHLREKQFALMRSLSELEQTEAKLRAEEKLAAVGRFSSAIAHEIRNPVAMISSALAMAENLDPGSPQNREMQEIATKEAARLEQLTSDFLAYARPRSLQIARSDVGGTVGYIADILRPRASESGIDVVAECEEPVWAEIDAGQLQQALLNVARNAVEASRAGQTVTLRARRNQRQIVIEVDNANGAIPAAAVACIFEPFFTTKPSGTGLGLAIARNIVLAHGGDLTLAENRHDLVRFVILIPFTAPKQESAV